MVNNRLNCDNSYMKDLFCEKCGWSWADFEFDIDLNFN